MAVGKRQGRENPAKIEQRKVKGMSSSGEQTALLAGPICTGQARGRGHRKEGLKDTRAPTPHAGTLLHSLLCPSLGWHALTLRGWILLLSSK